MDNLPFPPESPYRQYIENNEDNEIQDEFGAIFNSITNVQLPKDLVIRTVGFTVDPKDKSKLCLIQSSAHYVEAILK